VFFINSESETLDQPH